MLPGQLCCCSAAITFWRHLGDPAFELALQSMDEEPHQRGDVLGALSQGGEMDREDAQAIVQVGPETTLGDFPFEVPMCGRDDADVYLPGTR